MRAFCFVDVVDFDAAAYSFVSPYRMPSCQFHYLFLSFLLLLFVSSSKWIDD